MYGSRFLFRGYGTWQSMRPVDAALAGVDTLVLVDEAHLARHLMRLVQAASDCGIGSDRILNHWRSCPQVVALTATGDASEPHRFELDSDDEAHPIVSQRLNASKPLKILKRSGAADLRLAEAARSLLGQNSGRGVSCIVFANTPATARGVYKRLRAKFQGTADVVLLTGRTREWEAEQTREQILDPDRGMVASPSPAAGRKRHMVVVATQTLEVGADVDAEYLVTEACGVRALTQRLGRLNRMGTFPGAKGIYVHLPPPAGKRGGRGKRGNWPVYGTEPATVLKRLLAAADSGTKTVSVPPRIVADVLGEPADDPGRAPEVLRGILYEWVKTTTPPEGAAPVEPYFSGVSGADYSVSVVWRSHVPQTGDRLWPRASDREAVDVPISEARLAFGREEQLFRLDTDGVTIEETTAHSGLRPGDIIVLPSDRGLLDQFGWDPNATGPVRDLTVAKHGMALNAEALRRLFKGVAPDPFSGVRIEHLLDRVLGVVADDQDRDAADERNAISELIETVATAVPVAWEEAEWRAFVSSLDLRVTEGRREVSRLRVGNAPGQATRSDDLDELSVAAASTATDLEAHGTAVGTRSRSIAACVGLWSDLTDVVALAGRTHDLGKAESRFQRWLDPEEHTVLLAKSGISRHLWSRMRVAAGWPKGGRHEALSSRLVVEWLEDREGGRSGWEPDLLTHLVMSHHGSGRPIVPPVSDGIPGVVSAVIEGESVQASADLSLVDWDQPARFRRLNDRFGFWGLALLETIVRQADHSVSAGAVIWELEGDG